MKEWSDEELDKLFRKSAEELDPPYELADWNNLRRRLDEADGIRPGGGWLKKTGPWLAVGLLLLIGGLGAYYGTGGNEGQVAPSVVSTRPTGRPSAQVPDAGGAEAPDLTGKAETLELEGQNPTENLSQADSRTVPQESGKPQANTERKDTQELKELPRSLASVSGVRDQPNRSEQERGEGAILLANKSLNRKSEKGKNALRLRSLVKRPLEKDGLLTGQPLPGRMETSQGQESGVSAGDTPGVANESALRESWPILSTLANRSEYLPGTRLDYPVLPYAAPIGNPLADSKPEIQIPLWSVRIGVSPDLSVVHMSDMLRSMQPGPSASLLVERSIGEKWSLQTGIIRSLKKYSAPFSDYHPDKHLYQKTMPVSVDGSCTVFEVPLNVRFDFSQRPKTRWFVGVGLSSYKMQKENYIYNYDTYVHNAVKGWGGSTGWYFLSHANASVGYERRLAKRLSLVAEPYVRIPLRGVGFGKVNLITGGVWFSLRYTPIFRK